MKDLLYLVKDLTQVIYILLDQRCTIFTQKHEAAKDRMNALGQRISKEQKRSMDALKTGLA